MARYKAPEHTTEIFLPSRPYRADSTGHIEVPDDLALEEVTLLCAAGFYPVPPASSAKGKDS